MVRLTNVTKKYGMGEAEIKALDNISLEIAKGEIVSVIGKSGAGKTTLLKMIGGTEPADSGSIMVNDMEITKLTDNALVTYRNKHIGFVFQDYRLIPELTLLENIILPSLTARRSYDKEYLNYLTESLSITDRLSHYPSESSGGQQQRAAIARALINKPDVVLCDEPTGNLDSSTSAQVFDTIVRLSHANDQTVIIATHDMDIVRLTDRSITLKDGVIA